MHSMQKPSSILQLKITLIGSTPHIWRKILVRKDETFFALHVAIQDAMGWQDSHLHHFFTASPYKRNAKYQRISHPMPTMNEGDEEDLDEREIKLSEWLHAPKSTVFYEYDFGDSWMHEVKLGEILPPEPHTTYPTPIDGIRACPPEDCGGIGGYGPLLQGLADPKDEEHTDMLEWLGLDDARDFDPEGFDKDAVEFQDPKQRLQEIEKDMEEM